MIDVVPAQTGGASARWERWLQDLIRLPSTFEGEHAAVSYVAARIEELGLRVHSVAHDRRLDMMADAQRPFSEVPGRRSIVCRIPGDGTGRSLILNAHVDIVPAGDDSAWTHPPYSGHVDADQRLIFGRGAVDDKAGVTILLALIELFRNERLGGDLIVQFVIDDETSGNGSLLCLDAGWTADAALIVDGTRPDRAICQHAGQLQFTICVRGRAASISVAHMGVNAAETLARLLLHLHARVATLNANLEPPWSRFPSPYQFVVQRLQSDSGPLTVPDQAEATAWISFPTPHTLAGMRALVEDAIRDFTSRADVVVKFDGFCAEPVQTTDGELTAALRASARELGMAEIDVGPSTGISDMRHFVARGIPCLLYGPGRGWNPHRPNESYALDDLTVMARFYSALIRRWCRPA